MNKFNNGFNVSSKYAKSKATGTLPRFLENRWEVISCKSDDELNQRIQSRADSDGTSHAAYMNYISD
jgi:hypothetical protein